MYASASEFLLLVREIRETLALAESNSPEIVERNCSSL